MSNSSNINKNPHPHPHSHPDPHPHSHPHPHPHPHPQPYNDGLINSLKLLTGFVVSGGKQNIVINFISVQVDLLIQSLSSFPLYYLYNFLFL